MKKVCMLIILLFCFAAGCGAVDVGDAGDGSAALMDPPKSSANEEALIPSALPQAPTVNPPPTSPEQSELFCTLNEWQRLYTEYLTKPEFTGHSFDPGSMHLIDVNFDGIPEILFGRTWELGWFDSILALEGNKAILHYFDIFDKIKLAQRESDGTVLWICTGVLGEFDYFEMIIYEYDFIQSFEEGRIVFLAWTEYDEKNKKQRYYYSMDGNDINETHDWEPISQLSECVLSGYNVLEFQYYSIETSLVKQSIDNGGNQALVDFLCQWE